MKKGYWVVAYRTIHDQSALQAYSSLAGPAVEANGGRVLVRSADVKPLEEGMKQRTVVIEFESLERAVQTYESEPYRAALKALGSGVERDFRIAEGA